jgi:hypothetical protein
MTQMFDLKGFGAFDDDDETISFVSGRLTGAPRFDNDLESLQKPGTQMDAQKKSELDALLLMASLMLGGRSAANA